MSDWKQILFNKDLCQGSVMYNGTGDLVIQGKLKKVGPNTKLFFWAAAPPTNGVSFSGSGMPYSDPSVAYDRTPNKGIVEVNNGSFAINIKYPNAYYVGLGTLYIAPHVNFKICEPGHEDTYFTVQIDGGIPFRTLTWPAPPSKNPRSSPMFYCMPEKGARTQESILRASAYPAVNVMPDNFWGDRPPR